VAMPLIEGEKVSIRLKFNDSKLNLHIVVFPGLSETLAYLNGIRAGLHLAKGGHHEVD
jgi:hypothetical protein